MSLDAEVARFIDRTGGLTREDVEDVTAVLILLAGEPAQSTVEQEALEHFVERAALTADLPADQLATRVAAYLHSRPSLKLVSALGVLMREDLAQGADPSRAIADLLASPAGRTGVLGGGKRPQGTVAAGPGAQFALLAKVPKPPT